MVEGTGRGPSGPSGPQPGPGRRRRLLFAATAAGLTYLLAELVLTVAASRIPPPMYYVVRDGKGAIAFDPVSGYRQYGSHEVTLLARDANPLGVRVHWQGRIWGNSLGYPDSDDFGPRRLTPGRPRVVVLGDSFTGGWLADPWPEAAQRHLAGTPAELEISNLALLGHGVANWDRQIAERLVREKWELDGVVVAVWPSDLERPLFVSDMTGDSYESGRVRDGRAPATLAEARRSMQPWFVWPLDATDYARALAGDWKPPRDGMPFLLGRALRTFRAVSPPAGELAGAAPAPARGSSDEAVAAFAGHLRDFGRPVLIVSVPSRESLTGEGVADFGADARRLAELAGAEWIDGREPFRGSSPGRIAELWIEGDAHWRQEGSDVFARFAADRIAGWAARTGIRSK